MPGYLRPKVGAAVPTKKVTPKSEDAFWDNDSWATEGETAEWFEILRYLDPKVNKDARAQARVNTSGAMQAAREEIDSDIYYSLLFKSQVRGWRFMAPAEDDGTVEDFAERTFVEGNYRWWKFTDRNVVDLAGEWEIGSWLAMQIQSCGGAISTRDVVLRVNGQDVTFRDAPRGVVSELLEGVVDSERGAVLSAVPDSSPDIRSAARSH